MLRDDEHGLGTRSGRRLTRRGFIPLLMSTVAVAACNGESMLATPATATPLVRPTEAPAATIAVATAAAPPVENPLSPAPSVVAKSEPAPKPSEAPPRLITPEPPRVITPAEFIKTDGRKFTVGGKEKVLVGFNRYDLLSEREPGQPDRSCGTTFSQEQLEGIFKQLSLSGFSMMRFWAFPKFIDSGEYLDRMKMLVTIAGNYDVTLVPVLNNNWGDCTGEPEKKSPWYSDGYKAPGINGKSYIDSVQKLVSAFAGSPQIAFWQMMNEAQTPKPEGGDDPQALADFAKDMYKIIKEADPNHLVSLGVMGSGQPGTGGDSYRRIHEFLDILTYHHYPKSDGSDLRVAIPPTLDRIIKLSEEMQKPLAVTELGIKVGCTEADCTTKEERAALYEQILSAYLPRKIAAVGFWSWPDLKEDPKEKFDILRSDPSYPVLERFAQQSRAA